MGQVQRRNAELVDLLSADFINCWTPIEQVVLKESIASVTFYDIPQNFRALMVMGQVRSNRTAEQDVLRVRFNDDMGDNYAYLQTDFRCIDTIDTDCDRTAPSIQIGLCEAATSEGNTFSPFLFQLSGYARVDRTKWLMLLRGGRVGDLSEDGDIRMSLAQGLWKKTEPITSVTVYPGIGPKFVIDCILELYGVL